MTWVWLNGQICSAESAYVPVTDRGLTLGDGLFETVRVYKGQPLRLGYHAQRLQAGGHVLGLPVPSQAQLAQSAVELLAVEPLYHGSLRFTVTRSSGPRGLLPPPDVQPTVFITAASGTPTCSAVALITSQHVRQDELSPLCGMKTLNYLPYILARQEAAHKGADEALLLNTQGRVAETTISTVVVLTKEGFVTPHSTEGALPGVARRTLLEAGVLQETRLEPEALLQAEAVYLTNSLGVRTVRTLDGKALSQNAQGLARLCAILALSEFLPS